MFISHILRQCSYKLWYSINVSHFLNQQICSYESWKISSQLIVLIEELFGFLIWFFKSGTKMLMDHLHIE